MNRKKRSMGVLLALLLWMIGAVQTMAAGGATIFLHVHTASGGQVRVTCEASQLGNITNGKLKVYYNTAQVKLVKAQPGTVLAGANPTLNTDKPGQVILPFASANAFPADGIMLDMTFALQGSTKADALDLRVEATEMANLDNKEQPDIAVQIGSTRVEPQNQGDNNQGDNNQGDNNQGGNNQDGNTVPTIKDIAKTTVDRIPNQVYNKKAKKPRVKVRDGQTLLTQGKDYTVSYRRNKNTGKAIVTIQGKGAYTGKKTAYFNIVPKKAVMKKKPVSTAKGRITVTWKKDAQADGYEVQCSLNKKFKKGLRKVSAGKKKVTSVVRKCKSQKTYYVRVRSYRKIDGKKVYGAYSKAVKVRVK